MAGTIYGATVYYDADCNLDALKGKKSPYWGMVHKAMRMRLI